MRKKLVLNTVVSLLLQIVTVVCGFILPRLMLKYYGSEINGLTQSIAQFLGVVSFLEMGVGQVIQSSLYEPLSTGKADQINKVLRSGSNYFRKIASAILIYIIIFSLIYPHFFGGQYSWGYIISLIFAMGMGALSQYYCGLIDRILLSADQRGYVQFTAQIICSVFNIVIVSYLISHGCSVQTVKWVTALIFLLSPLIIRCYVNRNYNINRKITYEDEPIKQKWSGIAQHIANVILEGTDIIVLTIFSTLSNVSIYSVYLMVISGIRQLYTSATSGIQSMIGTLWANKDMKRLKSIFQIVEIVLHLTVVFLFTCIAILIVPFVKVYTLGVTDCNYIQPLFAVLLTFGYAVRCLRTPYNILILAGGHYKQTQRCHIVAAILNIIISIIAVSIWGLVGIAIGTLVAFVYQTLWMMVYNSKHLLKWPIIKMAKQLVVDIVATVVIYIITSFIDFQSNNYIEWFKDAVCVATIALATTVIVGFVFYYSELKRVLNKQK